MPSKKNYSYGMTNQEFFAAWQQYKPLAYLVVLTNRIQYGIVDTPLYGGIVEDYVGRICLEMHRLGYFWRYDSTRNDNYTSYVGSHMKAIMKHDWQDYCRTYLGTVSIYEDQAEDGKAHQNSIVDDTKRHDLSFGWSFGCAGSEGIVSETPDSRTEFRTAIRALLDEAQASAAGTITTQESEDVQTVIKCLAASDGRAATAPLTVQALKLIIGHQSDIRANRARKALRSVAETVLVDAESATCLSMGFGIRC